MDDNNNGLYKVYRASKVTKEYNKLKKTIMGNVPEETELSDFPGNLVQTEHGEFASNIVDGVEHYIGRIDSDFPLHQIGKTRDILYILEGSALFSFGNAPGEPKQRIGKALVANQYDIVERFPLVAWKIQPVKFHGMATPLFIRGIMDPPYDEKNYVKIDQKTA